MKKQRETPDLPEWVVRWVEGLRPWEVLVVALCLFVIAMCVGVAVVAA